MGVGPDVHEAHLEDTERYVLTNLNMVSAARAAPASGMGLGTPPRSSEPRTQSPRRARGVSGPARRWFEILS